MSGGTQAAGIVRQADVREERWDVWAGNVVARGRHLHPLSTCAVGGKALAEPDSQLFYCTSDQVTIN